MPTYLVLGNYTEQGIRAIKDTTKRADALRDIAKKFAATVKECYWTIGQYDVACVVDAPDDAAISGFGLSVAALGNVRTQTMRAFDAEEMGRILGRLG